MLGTAFTPTLVIDNSCPSVDDLSTLNNNGILGEEKENIYPRELVCNKENEGIIKATFLDMETTVIDKKFITKTYDKRDSYSFEIVSYPDLSGNIPQNAAYGVYTSQIIRYARVCSDRMDFLDRVKLLKDKLKTKGFVDIKLDKTARKCLHKNQWILRKYQHQGFKVSDL